VILEKGDCDVDVWICLFLTLLGWIPVSHFSTQRSG
jgi:uncharacterized membrane protein YqaE (UPF0057 family)